MAVVIADYSSNCTEVAFAFPTNVIMRGARVVAHAVFPTLLNALSHLSMFGGVRKEFSESICARSAVVMLSRRDLMLMSTSSLVPTV